jgi:hypothetical protein
VAVGIVHFEGDAYRRGLRERRKALALDVKKVETPEVKPEAVSPPTPSPRLPEEAVIADPPPVDEPKPPVVAHVETKHAPTPKPRIPAGAGKSKAGGRPAALPADTKEPVVKLPPTVIPNLLNLSAADEIGIGNLLHDVILANHGDDPGNPQLRTVYEAAQPIIDMRTRKEIEIKITIVDSNQPSAFSHLGGFVYLTKGLLSLAATDEEYQFIVGREVAHIDLKHGVKAVDEAMRAGAAPGVGTIQYLYHQIAAGKTEARELQADDWVVERMFKLEPSKRACLAFLRRLEKYSVENDFQNGGIKPKTDLMAPVQDVDNALKSLPAPWKRLKRLDDRLKLLLAAPAPTEK